LPAHQWNQKYSQELVEGLLGLPPAPQSLHFIQSIIASMTKRALLIGKDKYPSDGRVGNISLYGTPVISAIIFNVDAKAHKKTFRHGPCSGSSNGPRNIIVQKESFIFVPPAYVEEYSGDFSAAATNPEFKDFVGDLKQILFPKLSIDFLENPQGGDAGSVLISGSDYVLKGQFMDPERSRSHHSANSLISSSVTLVSNVQSTTANIQVNAISATQIHITVTGKEKTPSRIGLIQTQSGQQSYAITQDFYTII